MPKYKVLEKSNIDNEMFEEGAIIDYDGWPSANLEPMDDEGRAKVIEFDEVNKKRIAQMIADNPSVPTFDADGFAAAVAKAIAEANKDQAAQMQLISEALAKLAAK